jgi:hypothetical protein
MYQHPQKISPATKKSKLRWSARGVNLSFLGP